MPETCDITASPQNPPPALGQGQSRATGGFRTRGVVRQGGDPQHPLVTIITASFNAAATLRQCLDSVAGQTYGAGNIEHIVVDGGSTDGTLEILREYDGKGAIAYYVSEKDAGVYDAMNKGLKLATGEIIVFLNTDDQFEPGAVADSTAALLAADADYTYADAVLVDRETGQATGTFHGDLANIYFHTPYCHQTHFCKRRCFEELGGFDLSLRVVADYDFMWRLVVHGCRAARLKQPIVRYSIGGLSSVFSGQEALEVQQRQAQAYRNAFDLVPGLCRNYLWKSLGKLATALTLPEEKRQRYAATFRQTYAAFGLDDDGLRQRFRRPRRQLYIFLVSRYTSATPPPRWILALAARLLYYEFRLRRLFSPVDP